MGLQPSELWEMSYSEFTAALQGYLLKEEKEWNKIRTLMANQWNAQPKWGKGNKKMIRPQDLMKLPRIDQQDETHIDPQKIRQQLMQLGAINNKK